MSDDDPIRKLTKALTPLGLTNTRGNLGLLTSALSRTDSLAGSVTGLSRVFQGLLASQTDIGARLGLHNSFGSALGFPRSKDIAAVSGVSSAMSTLLAMHERLTAPQGIGATLEILRAADATLPKSISASIESFNSMRSAVISAFPSELHSMFNDRLAGSIVPTITALGSLPVDLPTGIFSLLDDQKRFGSLAWLMPSEADIDEPRVAVAAWRTEMPSISPPEPLSDQRVTINLRCKVECMFCGGQLLSADQQVTSTSQHEIVVTLAVVPICADCTHCARQDPAYFLKQIEELGRPRLRLIKGEGAGDGVPGGQLELVNDDSAEPEEGE